MQVYGKLDLTDNVIANIALEVETDFPALPKEGRLVFKGGVIYICVLVVGQPSWIPLTNELQSLVFVNDTPSTTWTIPHAYNTRDIIVQVYDTNNLIIFPDTVSMSSLNEAVITFSTATAGKAVVICKRNS